MLYPSIFNDNLFDDLMNLDFPRFVPAGNAERKLYGKQSPAIMKTDVLEHEDHYEVNIDLPGFKKEEIKLELNNGYLTISTEKSLEKEKKGKIIRQERYAGTMQRSFYVGDSVTDEDIKAKYENGVLSLTIPKKEAKKAPEKKTILIEG